MNGTTPIDTDVSSVEGLIDVAHELIRLIASAPGSIIGLVGDLGAGKTTFVQAFLDALGVNEKAASPTFVIRRSYDISSSSLSPRFKKIVHVDAYRIEEANEIPATGILDDANDPEALLLVEWPERLGDLLQSHLGYIGTLEFSHINEGTRHLRFVPSTS